MRTALTLFLVALICVTLAWWLSLLPGTVSATIAGTTFEALPLARSRQRQRRPQPSARVEVDIQVAREELQHLRGRGRLAGLQAVQGAGVVAVEVLEEPRDAMFVDVAKTVKEIVWEIREKLGRDI